MNEIYLPLLGVSVSVPGGDLSRVGDRVRTGAREAERHHSNGSQCLVNAPTGGLAHLGPSVSLNSVASSLFGIPGLLSDRPAEPLAPVVPEPTPLPATEPELRAMRDGLRRSLQQPHGFPDAHARLEALQRLNAVNHALIPFLDAEIGRVETENRNAIIVDTYDDSTERMSGVNRHGIDMTAIRNQAHAEAVASVRGELFRDLDQWREALAQAADLPTAERIDHVRGFLLAVEGLRPLTVGSAALLQPSQISERLNAGEQVAVSILNVHFAVPANPSELQRRVGDNVLSDLRTRLHAALGDGARVSDLNFLSRMNATSLGSWVAQARVAHGLILDGGDAPENLQTVLRDAGFANLPDDQARRLGACLIFSSLGLNARVEENLPAVVRFAEGLTDVSARAELLFHLASVGSRDSVYARVAALDNPADARLHELAVLSRAIIALNARNADRAEELLNSIPDSQNARTLLRQVREGRAASQRQQLLGILEIASAELFQNWREEAGGGETVQGQFRDFLSEVRRLAGTGDVNVHQALQRALGDARFMAVAGYFREETAGVRVTENVRMLSAADTTDARFAEGLVGLMRDLADVASLNRPGQNLYRTIAALNEHLRTNPIQGPQARAVADRLPSIQSLNGAADMLQSALIVTASSDARALEGAFGWVSMALGMGTANAATRMFQSSRFAAALSGSPTALRTLGGLVHVGSLTAVDVLGRHHGRQIASAVVGREQDWSLVPEHYLQQIAAQAPLYLVTHIVGGVTRPMAQATGRVVSGAANWGLTVTTLAGYESVVHPDDRIPFSVRLTAAAAQDGHFRLLRFGINRRTGGALDAADRQIEQGYRSLAASPASGALSFDLSMLLSRSSLGRGAAASAMGLSVFLAPLLSHAAPRPGLHEAVVPVLTALGFGSLGVSAGLFYAALRMGRRPAAARGVVPAPDLRDLAPQAPAQSAPTRRPLFGDIERFVESLWATPGMSVHMTPGDHLLELGVPAASRTLFANQLRQRLEQMGFSGMMDPTHETWTVQTRSGEPLTVRIASLRASAPVQAQPAPAPRTPEQFLGRFVGMDVRTRRSLDIELPPVEGDIPLNLRAERLENGVGDLEFTVGGSEDQTRLFEAVAERARASGMTARRLQISPLDPQVVIAFSIVRPGGGVVFHGRIRVGNVNQAAAPLPLVRRRVAEAQTGEPVFPLTVRRNRPQALVDEGAPEDTVVDFHDQPTTVLLGPNWESVGTPRRDPQSDGYLLTARPRSGVVDNGFEGNLPLVARRYPELAARLGITLNADGSVTYPDVVAFNARLAEAGFNFRLHSVQGEISPRALVEGIAREVPEFPFSRSGAHHLHDIGVHLLGYAALPPRLVTHLRNTARALQTEWRGARNSVERQNVEIRMREFAENLDNATGILAQHLVETRATDLSENGPYFSYSHLMRGFGTPRLGGNPREMMMEGAARLRRP